MRHPAFSIPSIAWMALAALAGCAHSQAPATSTPDSDRPAAMGITTPVPNTFDQAKQQCDAGDQQGCVVLAGFYWRGTGVARDPAKAKSLIESACQAGNAMGCELRDRFASHAD